MRPRGCSVFTFVVIVVLAGCSDPPKAPITPSPISPISPSVSALSVSGIGVPLVEGQSVQLTATATLSDGTSSDVTARASWTSENTAVATISSAGLLQAVGGGEASLVATYQDLTARSPVIVGFDVSGQIHEAEPFSTPIADAQVEVIGGPSAGQKVTSDGNGRFSLAGITRGGFALVIAKDGYETVQRVVDDLPRDAHPNVILLQAKKTFTWRSDAMSGRWTFPITISRRSAASLSFIGEGSCRLQGTYTDSSATLGEGPSPKFSIFPYEVSANRWEAAKTATVLGGSYRLTIWMNYVWPSSKCKLTVTLKHY
jgi:hypothetical protein